MTTSAPALRLRAPDSRPAPRATAPAAERAQPAATPRFAPALHQMLRATGTPLDPPVRAAMEARFGHSFGAVRIHADAPGAAAAAALGARAFAVGGRVGFARGAWRPQDPRGQRLLAHELAHVIQQRTDRGRTLRLAGTAERGAEHEAAQAAATLHRPQAPVLRHRVPAFTVLCDDGAAERGEDEGPGFWGTIGGGLMGEFNEDPDFAMIGVDVGVSLVPILDQVSDVRDIIAHLYYLVAERQYDRVMRWVGLAFTLIGLVPEYGSAIKGASKFVIRGVRVVLEHLDDLLRPFRRLLPELVDFRRLHRYLARNWQRFVAVAHAAWDTAVAQVARLLARIPDLAAGALRPLREAFERVRAMAPRKLDEAFERIRQWWDEVMAGLDELGGLRPAMAGGAPPLPRPGRGAGDSGAMHMSRAPDELGGPRSTGEAIDDLEDTLRGSRAADPRDPGLMAEAGRRIEPGAVTEWARRLGPGWQVMTRAQWPPWLRRRFPRGGPDMVAINHAERRILVGDVAPSAASRVDVRPGMGRGAPGSARRAGERDLVRAGDEGTMSHMEKTLDDARRVAAGLPAELRDFSVFAQEYYWEAGRRLSRLIPVGP